MGERKSETCTNDVIIVAERLVLDGHEGLSLTCTIRLKDVHCTPICRRLLRSLIVFVWSIDLARSTVFPNAHHEPHCLVNSYGKAPTLRAAKFGQEMQLSAQHSQPQCVHLPAKLFCCGKDALRLAGAYSGRIITLGMLLGGTNWTDEGVRCKENQDRSMAEQNKQIQDGQSARNHGMR